MSELDEWEGRMIRLTGSDGEAIWFSKAWVQAVRRPRLAEYGEEVKAVLVLSGVSWGVREFPVVVAAMLGWEDKP